MRRKGASVDIHQLHVWMWEHRTRENYLSVGVVELAEMLGVAKFSSIRFITFMCEQGRLKKLARGKYVVLDPQKYVWENKIPPKRLNQQGRPMKAKPDV